MAEKFYTILTKIGKAKIANTTALNTKINLIKFKVGDGGGSYYNPTEDQTELVNKVFEGNISSITIDDKNPNWIVIETVIPGEIGGFTIREAGVFDDEDNLIAIGKYPETYKPAVQNGSTKDLYIRMILEVSNTSSVTLKVDPTVILATKKDIQILSNDLTNFKQEVNTQLAEMAKNTDSTRLTTDKTVTGAINELFTNANDGKTVVANAVTAKGVSASPTDTFATLASKIGQISTGKKYAIGSKSSTLATDRLNFISYDGSTLLRPYIEITGLAFVPSTIVCINADNSDVTVYYINNVKNTGTAKILSSPNTFFKLDGSIAVVNSMFFRLPVKNTGVTFIWQAFE